MIDFVFLIIFILGACVGSFVCCQVRREGRKKQSRWSQCESCHKRLQWYEKLPILSWLFLRGRCRYCGKKIGLMELVCEAVGALVYATLFLFWPVELGGMRGVVDGELGVICLFGIALLFISLIGYLALMDIKTKTAKQKLLQVSIGLGLLFWVPREVFYGGQLGEDLASLGIGILILAGIYFLLYKISNERLVGGAEWMVGLAMALILARWELSLLCLVLSNIAGAIIIFAVNTFLNKKIKSVPMLPFLALGFLLTLCIFFDFYVG